MSKSPFDGKRSLGDRNRWVLLIKELRTAHDCSLYEAERIALLQPTWRLWVEHQVNHDPQCARMARCHIRCNGGAALIDEKDGRLTVR